MLKNTLLILFFALLAFTAVIADDEPEDHDDLRDREIGSYTCSDSDFSIELETVGSSNRRRQEETETDETDETDDDDDEEEENTFAARIHFEGAVLNLETEKENETGEREVETELKLEIIEAGVFDVNGEQLDSCESFNWNSLNCPASTPTEGFTVVASTQGSGLVVDAMFETTSTALLASPAGVKMTLDLDFDVLCPGITLQDGEFFGLRVEVETSLEVEEDDEEADNVEGVANSFTAFTWEPSTISGDVDITSHIHESYTSTEVEDDESETEYRTEIVFTFSNSADGSAANVVVDWDPIVELRNSAGVLSAFLVLLNLF